MNIRRLALTFCVAALTLWLLAGGPVLAATPDADMRPLKTGVTVTGTVEADYSDGLLLTTDDGLTYLVITPDAVSLEQEETFQKKFKGRQVSLTGNVYRDEDGSLSLSVDILPER